jgi:hypothetical protein
MMFLSEIPIVVLSIHFDCEMHTMTGSQGWWELILPNNRQPGVVGTDHAQ